MTDVEESQKVRIRTMMAADAAQAINGKLYILGGGFDQLFMNPQAPTPFQHKFDLAVIVEVPWTAANEPYELVIEQLDADGNPSGYRAEAQMETGRPPGSRRGTSFSVPIALPVLGTFEHPGRYMLRGAINGEESARVAIEVVGVNAAVPPATP
jgi:hypothetical protein